MAKKRNRLEQDSPPDTSPEPFPLDIWKRYKKLLMVAELGAERPPEDPWGDTARKMLPPLRLLLQKLEKGERYEHEQFEVDNLLSEYNDGLSRKKEERLEREFNERQWEHNKEMQEAAPHIKRGWQFDHKGRKNPRRAGPLTVKIRELLFSARHKGQSQNFSPRKMWKILQEEMNTFPGDEGYEEKLNWEWENSNGKTRRKDIKFKTVQNIFYRERKKLRIK